MLVYDAKDVTVIRNGRIITGFADGDAITIGQNEEAFSTLVGIQGDVSQSNSNDKTGFCTLVLKATSPANQELKADFNRGDNTPLQVINANSGGGTSGGTEARIKKLPEESFSNEEGTREYEFFISDYVSK